MRPVRMLVIISPVSHMLASVLQKAGYTAGLYTSPHLKSFTERIRINGHTIPERSVVSFVERYKTLMEEISPSFFEVTVAMAFEEFVRQNVEIAVVETGMGGRLDSTNVLDPELTMITNIGMDHQQYLGDTLAEIAGEKAGIIKERTPVIISEYQEEVQHVFEKKAGELMAPLVKAWERYELTETTMQANLLTVRLLNKVNGQKIVYDTDMAGQYQAPNLRAVKVAADLLAEQGFDIRDEAVTGGLAHAGTITGMKGRWHVLRDNPLVVCDTAHNPEGIRSVVKQIEQLSYMQLWIIFGTVKDKDPGPVINLLPQNAFYVFCQPDMPRALDAETLREKAAEKGLEGRVEPDVNKALQDVLNYAGEKDLVYIGGSTFIVAELQDL